jgi:hypothetical protein
MTLFRAKARDLFKGQIWTGRYNKIVRYFSVSVMIGGVGVDALRFLMNKSMPFLSRIGLGKVISAAFLQPIESHGRKE